MPLLEFDNEMGHDEHCYCLNELDTLKVAMQELLYILLLNINSKLYIGNVV